MAVLLEANNLHKTALDSKQLSTLLLMYIFLNQIRAQQVHTFLFLPAVAKYPMKKHIYSPTPSSIL